MMIAKDAVERQAAPDTRAAEPSTHYLLRCHRIALDFWAVAALRALD